MGSVRRPGPLGTQLAAWLLDATGGWVFGIGVSVRGGTIAESRRRVDAAGADDRLDERRGETSTMEESGLGESDGGKESYGLISAGDLSEWAFST